MPTLTLYHPAHTSPELPGCTLLTRHTIRSGLRSRYAVTPGQERGALRGAHQQGLRGLIPAQALTLCTPAPRPARDEIAKQLRQAGLPRIARQIETLQRRRRPVLGIKVTPQERRALLRSPALAQLNPAKIYYQPGPVRLCRHSVNQALEAWQRGALRDTDFVAQRDVQYWIQLPPGSAAPSGLGLGERLPEVGPGPALTGAQQRWAARYLDLPRHYIGHNHTPGGPYWQALQAAYPALLDLGDDPNAAALFLMRAMGSSTDVWRNNTQYFTYHLSSLITEEGVALTLLTHPVAQWMNANIAAMVERLGLQRQALPIALRSANSALLRMCLNSATGQAILTYADQQARRAEF